jgi:hypothetical protein
MFPLNLQAGARPDIKFAEKSVEKNAERLDG